MGSQGPRLLLAVFSHERFVGLRNLLSSIEHHMDDAHVYVFDDNSTDPRIGRLLDEKANSINLRWVTTGDGAPEENRLGGLYRNINRALNVAIKEEYDLLLLLQDDHQILWFDGSILDQVHEFFVNHEEALMLDPRFIRRIQYHSSYGGEVNDPAISMRRGAIAVGFIPPKRAKQIGYRFGLSERESSDKALALGKRCYKSRLPFVADIPVTARFHIRPPFFRGRLWHPNDEERLACEPILKPFRDDDLNKVRSVPNDCAIFAEDVVRRTDGQDELYPHSYNTRLFGRYRALTLSAWLSEIRRSGGMRRLEPISSFHRHRRSRWTSFSLRMQRTNRLWSYVAYFVDSAKTGLFFVFLYPPIRWCMRRESKKFMNQLIGDEKASTLRYE